MSLAVALIVFVFACGVCGLLVGFARGSGDYEEQDVFFGLRPVKLGRAPAGKISERLSGLAGFAGRT